jgi:MFS transporter, DHA1 family, inner membrane transport protein
VTAIAETSASLTPTTRFAAGNVVAVMAVGVIGVLIAGLQPQLLGALVAEKRITTDTLGLLATVELLAMGIAAGAAGFVLNAVPLRFIACVALVVTVLADAVSPFTGLAELFAARTVAGLAQGVLIWVTIGLIVRSLRPERLSGIFLAAQTLAQLAVATALGILVIPAFGSAGGFLTLALISLAGVAALPWLPAVYPAIAHSDVAVPPIPSRGWLALLGVALYLAFIVAVWVYIEPLGLQRGVDPSAVRLIAPVSLAMQVAGAAAAAWLAGHLPARPVVVLAVLLNLVLLGIMGVSESSTVFVLASAAFGFLWLFVLPFQIPIVINADPSRRAAMLIGGAQLTGSSLGPFIVALLVRETDVRPVLWFGAVCALVGTLALIAGGRSRRV